MFQIKMNSTKLKDRTIQITIVCLTWDNTRIRSRNNMRSYGLIRNNTRQLEQTEHKGTAEARNRKRKQNKESGNWMGWRITSTALEMRIGVKPSKFNNEVVMVSWTTQCDRNELIFYLHSENYEFRKSKTTDWVFHEKPIRNSINNRHLE